LYAIKKIAMAELTEKEIFRTKVKWQSLLPDLLLILFAVAFPITSFIIDLNDHRADWFARSGAVSAIIGIVLASRSIKNTIKNFFQILNGMTSGKKCYILQSLN